MDEANVLRKAHELSMLLAVDRVPEDCDVLYLPGLSKGMVAAHGIFETVAQFCSGKSIPIAYSGSTGETGWPGAQYYEAELKKIGISQKRWYRTRTGIHTRSEADEFALLAKDRGWRRVAVVTVSYHGVRAMSCHVAAMYANDYYYDAYFLSPRTVDWDLPMMGSQGKKETTSRNELQDEVIRIIEYLTKGADEGWREGYGAPPDMFLEYLRQRDQT